MKISPYLLPLLSLSIAAPALACDFCGCYTPSLRVVDEKSFSLYGGAAEQFTHFGTERLNGVKQPNPAGEYIDSSITQFVVGASFFHDRVAVQLSVPYIYRAFQRQLGFDIDRGHVDGLGDLTLTTNVTVFRKEALFHEEAASYSKDGKQVMPARRGEPDFSATVSLTAGIKFPTGDSDRLKENYRPDVEGAPDSGIGPHDLALGSGSVDGIFGIQAELRYKALFLQAELEYSVRGYGDFQFRYANELAWSGGPGVYLYRKNGKSLGVQCVVAGETKGYDRFQGVPDPDSGVTALYVGPRIVASFGRINGEVSVDLPVIMNATSFQTTADYRIRAGFTVQF
ncbi:hypothetical protein CfE428DRAFT_4779 [Chthoniobacter flavus Ellin428]|uniref:Transporter n=1 Tax=Chthoniobacter flavus Ellin428 TaxID=497964 RepID=B4D789_9BACT|nr:hypothetical protein [Chthoniobacter flavus]EDY17740.1 hypothetical protein CfE428DRAFT_4779 [Chthoniobacter flavus Ellin428]TCO87065.1 hypothetical protein EV701_12442 [Chthoniobacter flavus]